MTSWYQDRLEAQRKTYTFKNKEFMRPDRPASFFERWDARPLREVSPESQFHLAPMPCAWCGEGGPNYKIISNRRSPYVIHNRCEEIAESRLKNRT